MLLTEFVSVGSEHLLFFPGRITEPASVYWLIFLKVLDFWGEKWIRVSALALGGEGRVEIEK